MKKIKKLFVILFMFYSFFAVIPSVKAEQTIINIPSSEVLPQGELILKDSNKYEPLNGYAAVTPSVTFGIGRGFELSTGVASSFNNDFMARGDFAAKKVWFIGHSTRLTVGGKISPYFKENGSPDSFLYSHISQRIKKTKTSVTAGIYLNGSHHFPNQTGAIVGLEQVLIPNKLRFAFDWMSSLDSSGKIGVGLKYRPVPTVSITGAVIIPNKDCEDVAFNVSVSKFISTKNYEKPKRRL